MASTGQFSEHLIPGLREIVGTRLEGRESYYTMGTKVAMSQRSFEEHLAGAGLPIATEKPEREPIDTFDPLEGNKMRIAHTTYAIGMEISEEADEDDLYKGKGSALEAGGNGIADSLAEIVEVQAHRFFNSEAFLTSAVPSFLRTLPDNSSTVSVFNTAHNPVAGGESGSQSNRPSADVDLTVTSFRTALTQFKRYRNDRNLRIPGIGMPVMLMVPPEEEWTAREIVGNPTRPDSANDVKNVTSGMVKLVVNPYLDDPDSWFLLAAKHWLTFLWRRRPRLKNYDDVQRGVAVVIGDERFGIGAVHWMGTYGSPGG